MTNLSDFLKVKQVRCVSKNAEDNLTIGKEYNVTHIIFGLQSDNNAKGFYDFDSFEPVLDSAENPLQNIELTPEFEAVEPTFKVGDRVYYGSEPRLLTIAEVDSDGWVRPDRWVGFINYRQCCHATTENYGRLQATFPDIKFERPQLTGSDLARAMFEKGWHLVPCVVSDVSDSDALNNDNCCLVDEWCVNYFESDGYRYEYAVPFDPRTGEPLTESVLND